MSYSYTDEILADCGAVNPLTGDQCSMPPHTDGGPHEANGILWGDLPNRPTVIPPARRQEFREITPDDPAVVEAFAFALFATGARLNGVGRGKAATLWRGAAVEDRAVWESRAAEVVDAALSYVPA